jgi:hypothetical protein
MIFILLYIDLNANIESLFKEEDTTSPETAFVISCNKEIQMIFVVAFSSLDIFATCPTYLDILFYFFYSRIHLKLKRNIYFQNSIVVYVIFFRMKDSMKAICQIFLMNYTFQFLDFSSVNIVKAYSKLNLSNIMHLSSNN